MKRGWLLDVTEKVFWVIVLGICAFGIGAALWLGSIIE